MKPFFVALVSATVLFSAHSHADDVLKDLKIYKAGGMQHGKWQIEALEGTDPSMQQMMHRAGKMSICVDIFKQMTSDYQRGNSQADSCTHKIIKNETSTAEVESDCSNGSHTHSVITRDGDKTYITDGTYTSKDNRTRRIRARYTYVGECSGDEGAIQLDKDSPACKKMHEKTQGVDMTAMCARLQGDMREQCEKQIKNVAAACQ